MTAKKTADERRTALVALVGEDATTTKLIDEAIYLEGELDELRKLPKLKVDPKNKTRQKATPAARLYREHLQQYTNVMKILIRVAGIDETEEDSPLRAWMKEHTKE